MWNRAAGIIHGVRWMVESLRQLLLSIGEASERRESQAYIPPMACGEPRWGTGARKRKVAGADCATLLGCVCGYHLRRALSSGVVESLCYVRAVVRDILYLASFRTF